MIPHRLERAMTP